MDKKELYMEICGWYNYDTRIEEDGKIKEYDGYHSYFEHDSITEALKHWLKTLEQSNETHLREEGEEYYLWNKEVIEFIKSL